MSSRENDLQAVGRKVRAARQKAGLSQIELALALQVSLSTISRLERGLGSRGAPIWRLRQLADALNVETADLLPKEDA